MKYTRIIYKYYQLYFTVDLYAALCLCQTTLTTEVPQINTVSGNDVLFKPAYSYIITILDYCFGWSTGNLFEFLLLIKYQYLTSNVIACCDQLANPLLLLHDLFSQVAKISLQSRCYLWLKGLMNTVCVIRAINS